jgi:hypothetical protein
MKIDPKSLILIAEFEGYELNHETKPTYAKNPVHGSWVEIENLHYDSSFDWMIPVVKKCREFLHKYDASIWYHFHQKFHLAVDENNTLEGFNNTVELVKLYNFYNKN